MIRAVDNKRLYLSNEEYGYYLKLVETFGKEDFSGLFSTDKNGIITSVSPPVDRKISMGVLFFVLNVMMNQRLRAFEEKIKNNIASQDLANNIVERLGHLEKKLEALEDEKSG